MKKVLIITYYWPPAGGPGVQRWLKFVKYLPEFGVQPVVYIPENPHYPIVDDALLKDVPKGIQIIKKRIIEPYGLAGLWAKKKISKISAGIITASKKQSFFEKIALWIRGNIFIPDARVLWVRPSARFLKKHIEENNIDTVITSGPPHSLHLIGLKLQSESVKWIADFRDPWTTIGYQKALKLTGFAAKRHLHLEERVLTTADALVVTSKTTKAEFRSITNKPIAVITNGYDVVNYKKQPLDQKFSLAHIGSLLSARNPAILWVVLQELITEIPGFSEHLEIKLTGTTSQEVLDAISMYGLEVYLSLSGYVSHDEAIRQQRTAQVLLLLEINSPETCAIIPGKLFEYLVSGRPIIGIGPKKADFAEIIQQTNTGVFVDYDQKDKLKRTVEHFYTLFLQNDLRTEAIGLDQYSRRNLTSKLAQLISSLWV